MDRHRGTEQPHPTARGTRCLRRTRWHATVAHDLVAIHRERAEVRKGSALNAANPIGDGPREGIVGEEQLPERREAAPFGRDRPCLLDTSPSPRDLSTSRMPSSA